MKEYKINPQFETPELRDAFENLLRATEAVKRKETELRLSVYKDYELREDYINKN